MDWVKRQAAMNMHLHADCLCGTLQACQGVGFLLRIGFKAQDYIAMALCLVPWVLLVIDVIRGGISGVLL